MKSPEIGNEDRLAQGAESLGALQKVRGINPVAGQYLGFKTVGGQGQDPSQAGEVHAHGPHGGRTALPFSRGPSQPGLGGCEPPAESVGRRVGQRGLRFDAEEVLKVGGAGGAVDARCLKPDASPRGVALQRSLRVRDFNGLCRPCRWLPQRTVSWGDSRIAFKATLT